MYGYSKHLFDLWAKREGLLKQIVGLKYFNVYGPNEYHKGDILANIDVFFILYSWQPSQAYGGWSMSRGFGLFGQGCRYLLDLVDEGAKVLKILGSVFRVNE